MTDDLIGRRVRVTWHDCCAVSDWVRERYETEDPPDPWDASPIHVGDFVRHTSALPDWWELVIAWGPDGRMITVDKHNKIRRSSDPTDRWEIIDPPTPDNTGWPFRPPRGFRGKDCRSYPAERMNDD